jgi:hypothetical protein
MFQFQVDSMFYSHLFCTVVSLVAGVDFDADVFRLEILVAADLVEPYCSICL